MMTERNREKAVARQAIDRTPSRSASLQSHDISYQMKNVDALRT
jgi:hypothetical protein